MASLFQLSRCQIRLEVALICILLLVGETSSSSVLIFPGISIGSAINYFSKLGEHLVNAGHDVTLLVGHHNDLHKTPRRESLFTIEKYNSTFSLSEGSALDKRLSEFMKGEFRVKDMHLLTDSMLNDCEVLMDDKELFDRLSQTHFDIAVVHSLALCTVLVAQRLDLPFVLVSTNRALPQFESYYLAMPSPLSYVPACMTALTDNMNFAERLKNVLFYTVSTSLLKYFLLKPYDELKQLHGIQPDIDIQTSLGKAEIVLLGVDWAVEFPRPVMPNTVFLGGLLAEEPAPLDAEWTEFVDSADDGIVVFSLGSMMNPGAYMEKAEIITAALARLPQKVVMRYEGEIPKSLGNNTKLTKWMPQNDLLGHPKARAFIGHGGMNGIYQAIYHGVPMVGMPMFSDHYDNFARLAAKGMAVTVNIVTMTSDDLYDAVKTVVDEPRFKASAMHLSGIHRDKPMSAGDTAVFWIEHVIKHGGQHLRAEALNLNFVQYFLLDVIGFILLALFGIVFSLKFILSCCCRRFKSGSRKEKTN